MSPAVLSLVALLLVLLTSLTSRINVGVLAVALAWPIGLYAAQWKADVLMATFPATLFLTLLGVTLLFAVAQANGTLAALAHRAVRLAGGHVALLPPLFFLLACAVSTVGPGAIAASALIAPLAMAIGGSAGVPAFLVALMVGNGANAGNLSPISAVGAMVQELMKSAGLGGHEWSVWAANFVVHALVALGAFLLFGGVRLARAARVSTVVAAPPIERRHWLTLAVTAAWIVGVVAFKANPGLSAFAAAAVLILAGAAEDVASVKAVPWSVIVMVCGVSVLIGVLEKTGGMDLFTTMLARISTPGTVNGTIAFVTGVISTYSSTSGVVYPAFLPAVPGLVLKLGGGDPLQVAMSINVGAALVDVSPLSTIGALCLAALPGGQDPRPLFRKLLAWGFAMAVVGAVFCQFAIGWFAG
ncbi:MAG TPA: SLC13 family permease [Gemmatimonadaceae bacterium]|nr:SLC13 family permease [Gemmatimonadaceae bacterium]